MSDKPEPDKPVALRPSFLKRLGDNLRRAREAVPISQRALARETKISAEVIGGMEHGSRNFTMSTLSRLARALGVTEEALLLDKQDGTEPGSGTIATPPKSEP